MYLTCAIHCTLVASTPTRHLSSSLKFHTHALKVLTASITASTPSVPPMSPSSNHAHEAALTDTRASMASILHCKYLSLTPVTPTIRTSVNALWRNAVARPNSPRQDADSASLIHSRKDTHARVVELSRRVSVLLVCVYV